MNGADYIKEYFLLLGLKLSDSDTEGHLNRSYLFRFESGSVTSLEEFVQMRQL